MIEHLRDSGATSTIALWGRSMGAVTSLLHADRDLSIAGMILDSPFSSLRQLAHELVEQFTAETKIPAFARVAAVGTALAFVKRSVRSRAGFDLDELSCLVRTMLLLLLLLLLSLGCCSH